MMADLGGIVSLMMRSPIHREYTVADLDRLVVPPLTLGQCIVLSIGTDIVGFGSYAFLNETAETGFISGARKLETGDWDAGDRIWLLDLVAPYGHGSKVTSLMRTGLRGQGHQGKTIRFRRNKGGPRRYSQVTI